MKKSCVKRHVFQSSKIGHKCSVSSFMFSEIIFLKNSNGVNKRRLRWSNLLATDSSIFLFLVLVFLNLVETKPKIIVLTETWHYTIFLNVVAKKRNTNNTGIINIW